MAVDHLPLEQRTLEQRGRGLVVDQRMHPRGGPVGFGSKNRFAQLRQAARADDAGDH